MSETTGIQWTEATWNPWMGCEKVSAECDLCYLFRDMPRFGGDPSVIRRSKTKFNDPLVWARSGKAPKLCFTCSWSDWFIGEADAWRAEAWNIVKHTPMITYQILTKRAGRILSCLPPDWYGGYPNAWLGVSVGVRATKQRISTLRQVPACVRFVSFEPLLEDLGDLDLTGIDWAIIGGESGAGCRPMGLDWARKLRDQCREQGVAVFVKQLGGHPDKRGEMEQFPEDLRIREYPREAR